MTVPDAKVYIAVDVHFTQEGQMLPRCVTWEDGRLFPIDRVKAVRPAHAERAGGVGDRYTVMIGGQERYLFFEHTDTCGGRDVGRWFLERKC